MNQKKSIVLIVAIAILLVGVFAFYKDTSRKPNHFGCSSEFSEAINKGNVSLCELTTETETVKNPYYDNICRESCIKEVAYKNENAQLCGLIKPFKEIPPVSGWDDPRTSGSYIDHCYIQLASKLKDFKLCEKVETNWAKSNCQALYNINANKKYI